HLMSIPTKKKIYIAGCGGMLGEAFYRVFRDEFILKCTDIDVNEPWIGPLDFRDSGSYKNDVTTFTPDYLFQLGSLTDLECCGANIDDTYFASSFGVENTVHIANTLGIPLLYISIAGIFEGGQVFFDYWDQPNPLGHYAR